MNVAKASDRAYKLRGLIEAKRTLGINDGFLRSLAAKFLEDFDMDRGVFKSQSRYSIDEMAAIFGTLNALRIFETADVDADMAKEVFKTF